MRAGGMDGGMDEEARGVFEDWFNEGRKIGVSMELKAETTRGK